MNLHAGVLIKMGVFRTDGHGQGKLRPDKCAPVDIEHQNDGSLDHCQGKRNDYGFQITIIEYLISCLYTSVKVKV